MVPTLLAAALATTIALPAAAGDKEFPSAVGSFLKSLDGVPDTVTTSTAEKLAALIKKRQTASGQAIMELELMPFIKASAYATAAREFCFSDVFPSQMYITATEQADLLDRLEGGVA